MMIYRKFVKKLAELSATNYTIIVYTYTMAIFLILITICAYLITVIDFADYKALILLVGFSDAIISSYFGTKLIRDVHHERNNNY